MYVLEREDRARARGAHVYATIDGYGSTCDAYHRVQMDPEGVQIVRAMRMALERAGRAPESIGYVNFHGTSTQLNDAIEIRCVREVFDAQADRMCGSSTKSMVGHPQGASGACGIVTTALAHRSRVPAADDQRHAPRSRRATWTSCPTTGAPPTSRRRCATASASDPRTARSSWGAVTATAGCRHRRRRAGRGLCRDDARARRARASCSSIATRFRATSCVATRSIPAAWRCCSAAGLAGPIEAHGLPLDGMLVTGAIRRVDPRAPTATAWSGGPGPRRHLDASCSRRRRRPASTSGRACACRRRWWTTMDGWSGCALAGHAAATKWYWAGGRSPPTDADRRWRSRWASSRHPVRPRRWAIGTYAEGVEGARRASARCTSARGTTSASRPATDGLANLCLVTSSRERMGDPAARLWRAVRQRPAAARALCPRAAGRAGRHAGAAGRRCPRRRRAGPAAGGRRRRLRRPDDRRRPAPGASRRATGGRGAARRRRRRAMPSVLARLATRAGGRRLVPSSASTASCGRWSSWPMGVRLGAVGASLAPVVLRHVIATAGDVAHHRRRASAA